jgi:hypothetical protein
MYFGPSLAKIVIISCFSYVDLSIPHSPKLKIKDLNLVKKSCILSTLSQAYDPTSHPSFQRVLPGWSRSCLESCMQQHETINQWILTQEVVMWTHSYGSPISYSQSLM